MTPQEKVLLLTKIEGEYKGNDMMRDLIHEIVYLLTDRVEDFGEEEVDDLLNQAYDSCVQSLSEARDELEAAIYDHGVAQKL